jgi:hypothetical protein
MRVAQTYDFQTFAPMQLFGANLAVVLPISLLFPHQL